MICPDCQSPLKIISGGNITVTGTRSRYRQCPDCVRRAHCEIVKGVERFVAWVDIDPPEYVTRRMWLKMAWDDCRWFGGIQPETLEKLTRLL